MRLLPLISMLPLWLWLVWMAGHESGRNSGYRDGYHQGWRDACDDVLKRAHEFTKKGPR